MYEQKRMEDNTEIMVLQTQLKAKTKLLEYFQGNALGIGHDTL